MTDCLNCNNNFEGAFCNICGQKAATHRFTLHEWLHEIPHSILHVDSGFFLTMKTLFIRPGNAIREYLEGKRKLLFSPFLYLLVLCGVFVVVSHYFADSSVKVESPDFTNVQETIKYIQAKYYKIIIILMILPLAISSFLVYLKSGYNFAEHLVLNTYLMGQLVIADIILQFISSTSFDENNFGLYQLIDFILKYPYWFWTYWQFFKPEKWYWGILQFILSIILSSIIVFLLIFVVAFFYGISKGMSKGSH